jgi:alkylated DNA repair dioxygenase AlkB
LITSCYTRNDSLRRRSRRHVWFNSLNINYYRNGNDHIGWHSDGEEEGSWEFPIASVSFGATRDFQTCRNLGNGKLKRRFHKYFGEPDQPVALEHGSLVVMPAGSQEFYVHRLKKATKQQGTGARINLTFRMMWWRKPKR